MNIRSRSDEVLLGHPLKRQIAKRRIDRQNLAVQHVLPVTDSSARRPFSSRHVNGVFLVVASGKQDDVNNAPTDTVEDLERLEDLENSGERFTLLGNAFLIAGTLAAITGGVLIGIQGIDRKPVDSAAAGIGPMMIGGDVVGVSLGGWF